MAKRPIRVLQVVGSLNYGGVEAMLMNWYKTINREEVQFDFLVRNSIKGVHEGEVRSLGGKIYRISTFTGFNPIQYYKECKAFMTEHPEHQIVHGHLGSSAALYLEAANKTNRFTIAHSHNANNEISVKNIGYAIWSYPTRYIANELFACSSAAGKSRFGVRATEKSNYRIFPNAIDLIKYDFNHEMREIAGRELGIGENTLLVGAIGRMSSQKNPEFILKIFESISANYSGAKCVWIGSGEYEARLSEIIRSKGLNNSIMMLGNRNDVEKLLQRIDCLIMPSLYEGLPVTIIEAQCSGTPCLISSTITKEVDITDLVVRKSIKERPQDWATTAVSVALERRQTRRGRIKQLREAGYDIQQSTKWLESFYLSKA